MVAAGGRVVAMDQTDDALAWTKGAEGIVGFAGDVTQESDNEAAIERTLSEFGRIDSLILNAGIAGFGPIEGVPLEEFERIMAVNVTGLVLGLRSAIPALVESGEGAVVVTASTSGLAGDPGMWAYNTSKGAAVNLVRSASLELAHRGVRVNGVCPGPTRTSMTAVIEKAVPDQFEAMRLRIPLQRWGEAEEVAAVIEFLASPAASFVTGVLVPVDGGISSNTGQFSPPQRAD
jgi:meso-butanediol dehydrogenase/(S,S)-butanediol dehydrogenase/diacetyl reductase